jgi:hypothetical protein
MATRESLVESHKNGFDSGDILSRAPDARRAHQEARIGGSYYEVVEQAIKPFITPTSRVLELGPGRGSWTKVFLSLVPHGEIHTIDLHDLTRFISPNEFGGRLHCHQVDANDYSFLENDYFDFFFSFGVLCHLDRAERLEILRQALPKMKPGAFSSHDYGDWKKLDALGWPPETGLTPEIKQIPEDESWWPQNDADDMSRTASDAGWSVVNPDLGLFKRDGLIVLRRP